MSQETGQKLEEIRENLRAAKRKITEMGTLLTQAPTVKMFGPPPNTTALKEYSAEEIAAAEADADFAESEAANIHQGMNFKVRQKR